MKKSLFLGIILFFPLICSANGKDYCPEPTYIAIHKKDLLAANGGNWVDKYKRKWEVSISIEKDEQNEPSFDSAVTWTFPSIEEGTFVECDYKFSENYKSSITLVSRFKLKSAPREGSWVASHDGWECDVDPFDTDNRKSGNILECPFKVSEEKPEYIDKEVAESQE
ncbi:MAG TPA: hypothetical protein VHE99_11415 [Gammaproteobacteria bacterium]|nr:hypothetical protein [Gammaproteobacteria bacterium]